MCMTGSLTTSRRRPHPVEAVVAQQMQVVQRPRWTEPATKKEEELHKIEYETNLIMQTVEQRLMDLDPDQKIEYEQLREENAQYISGIHNMRDQINRLNDELIEGENLLKNNPNKKEAHKTKDAINMLFRKKEELELQTNEVRILLEYNLISF